MNTKSNQNQKNQRQKAQQKTGPKKQGQNANLLQDERKHHEQEHPETRMTR
jgi:hypothetical protein